MKNYSLKPTEENALELLRANPILRNQYVFRFAKMLSYMEDDSVFHCLCTSQISLE